MSDLSNPDLRMNSLNMAITTLPQDRLVILAQELLDLESIGSHPQNELRQLARDLESLAGIPFNVAFDLVKRRIPMEIASRWVKSQAIQANQQGGGRN
jgi:hypothetical protein